MIEKFSDKMLEKYLKESKRKFLRDNDGDYLIRFSRDEDSDRELSVWLISSGKANELFKIFITADIKFPKQDWGKCLMLCNEWNYKYRLPRAYLYVEDYNSSIEGEIHLDYNLDFEKGIHQEFLNFIINQAISGAAQFWEWMHKEKGI